MVNPSATESPLKSAAGSAGVHVIDAFELLSNETRLAILLALWEAYDPHGTHNTVAFSELHDQIGVRDSGHFTYHLNKLVGDFVEETDDGYRLRNAGLKVVQATIAGAGFEERTLQPTEIDMSCHRCGGPVEISYENEYLYHICTECAGNTGPNFAQERPVGTLMMFDFDPAGLAYRTPGEVFVAGTIKSLRDFGLLIRGICPACSGPIDESVHICESHRASPKDVCPNCGTGDKIRVRYTCSVCKYGDSYPVHAAIYDHPAVVAFCNKHGIETTYALDDPEACGRLWSHLLNRTYTLVSEDPVRIRISVSGGGKTLYLTLDGDLTVIDTVEEAQDSPKDLRPSVPSGDGGDCTTGSCERIDRNLLPDKEDCLQYLRRRRWPDEITCPHCDSTDTIKKGTTGKGTQRYRCLVCNSIFNDLTGTLFANHRLSLPEMFYIISQIDETETARIARHLNRSYKSVLNFVHEVQDADERDGESDSLTSVKPLDSIFAATDIKQLRDTN